jgi:hypothetical protein
MKTLHTSQVSELTFIEVVDELQHNWGFYAVSFQFEGRKYEGIVQAQIPYPEIMHNDEIEDVVASVITL